MSETPAPRGVERFLRVFTDVRAGEAGTALLLTANVFLLLCAYSLLKVLREPLILAGGGDAGAEVKSYSSAGQALLLLIAVPLYGALASRFPRRRLINIVTGFFLACLITFFVLARLHAPIGVVFFIWLGIFNVMVIAQFWSFANDVYTTDAGKRLFPIVAFGQSLGAVAGAYLAGRAISGLGLYPLFLIAAGILVLGTILTNVVDARERRRDGAPAPAGRAEAARPAPAAAPVARGNAFALVFRSRYLVLIAFMILVLNWVNSTGEYILSRAVVEAASQAVASQDAASATAPPPVASPAESVEERKGVLIGKFYSSYQLGVNLLGLLLQLFVVSRILKYLGVRVAVMILPAIALFGYTSLVFVPILALIRVVKTAENATDYSIQNTVRQVLFLPTTREQKYKAKQAIDSFFVRAGDVLSAGLVYVGSQLLVLKTGQFALVNLALAAVWLVLAFWIGRENAKLTAPAPEVRAAA